MFSKTTGFAFWLFVLIKSGLTLNQVRAHFFCSSRLYRLENADMLCFAGFLDQVDQHYYKEI